MIVRSSPAALSHRPGITLLEVLVSMAIFLIAFAALSQLIDIGTNNALDATFQSDATRMAQSKLAEVEAGAIPPDGSASGSFDLEPGWGWSVEPAQTSIPNLYLVTVTVSRQSGSVSFKMSQMIFDSRQMGQSSEVVNPTTATTGSAAP